MRTDALKSFSSIHVVPPSERCVVETSSETTLLVERCTELLSARLTEGGADIASEDPVLLWAALHYLSVGVVVPPADAGVLRRAAGLDVIDQQLGAVMLDIGLVQQVFLDLAPAGRIEDLLLKHCVDLQFEAGLFGQRLLDVPWLYRG